jgi:hypothetical protein
VVYPPPDRCSSHPAAKMEKTDTSQGSQQMNFAKYKIKTIFPILQLLPFLSLVLLSGCASQHYQKAARINTIDAYEEFLKEYPDSQYTAEARDKIAKIKYREEYEEVKKAGESEVIEAFIQKYPNGIYTNPAKAQLAEALKYKSARQALTRQAFEDYLRKYPDGRWAKEAIDKIAEILGPEIKNSYEQEGRELALRWLAFLDEGRWSEASALTELRPEKSFGNQGEWEKFLQSTRQAGSGEWVRDRQGFFQESGEQMRLKAVSRRIVSARYTAQYGKRPIGDYIVVVCETTFDRAEAKETFVASRSESGKWLNNGYFVHLKR